MCDIPKDMLSCRSIWPVNIRVLPVSIDLSSSGGLPRMRVLSVDASSMMEASKEIDEEKQMKMN
jgi:hypothetical protein